MAAEVTPLRIIRSNSHAGTWRHRGGHRAYTRGRPDHLDGKFFDRRRQQ